MVKVGMHRFFLGPKVSHFSRAFIAIFPSASMQPWSSCLSVDVPRNCITCLDCLEFIELSYGKKEPAKAHLSWNCVSFFGTGFLLETLWFSGFSGSLLAPHLGSENTTHPCRPLSLNHYHRVFCSLRMNALSCAMGSAFAYAQSQCYTNVVS